MTRSGPKINPAQPSVPWGSFAVVYVTEPMVPELQKGHVYYRCKRSRAVRLRRCEEDVLD